MRQPFNARGIQLSLLFFSTTWAPPPQELDDKLELGVTRIFTAGLSVLETGDLVVCRHAIPLCSMLIWQSKRHPANIDAQVAPNEGRGSACQEIASRPETSAACPVSLSS